MRIFMKNPLTLAVVTSILATIQVPVVWSQDDEMMLEEVMVTARKREESLSETPIAITAITAADIQAGAFKSIVDVQKTAPGLFIESMNNENARTILMPRFRGCHLRCHQPASADQLGVRRRLNCDVGSAQSAYYAGRTH